jgi:hypothetical protein
MRGSGAGEVRERRLGCCVSAVRTTGDDMPCSPTMTIDHALNLLLVVASINLESVDVLEERAFVVARELYKY